MDKLLSVIIPVYNAGKYLKPCIESILSQEYPFIQLILVDDGSTDQSGQICDEFAERDIRVEVFHQQNSGVSNARNRGIDMAKGEYLTFVDADDKISTDAYSLNMGLLRENPFIDMLEYPVIYYVGTDKERRSNRQEMEYKGDDVFFRWIKEKQYLRAYLWNKIYKKEIFDDIRFPSDRVYEDIALFPSIMKRVRLFYVSTHGCYLYSYCPTSITVSHQPYKKIEDLFYANFLLWMSISVESTLSLYAIEPYNTMINCVIGAIKSKEDRKQGQDGMVNVVNSIRFSLIAIWKSSLAVKHKLRATIVRITGVKIYAKCFLKISSIR